MAFRTRSRYRGVQKDVDRTLIRENLRLTVEQRFENLMRLQKFAEEMRRAVREKLEDDQKITSHSVRLQLFGLRLDFQTSAMVRRPAVR